MSIHAHTAQVGANSFFQKLQFQVGCCSTRALRTRAVRPALWRSQTGRLASGSPMKSRSSKCEGPAPLRRRNDRHPRNAQCLPRSETRSVDCLTCSGPFPYCLFRGVGWMEGRQQGWVKPCSKGFVIKGTRHQLSKIKDCSCVRFSG